ncbi:MAG: BLUF domain-containing protein [Burkholderiales bacterium]|nr:BLUF domain-containing protein [Burkholderiales bacterium]
MLIRLTYASRVSPDVSPTALRDILATSQRNNERDGITGALVFTGSVFLQCLEGDRAVVNRTYHRIVPDERHSDPQILAFEEVTRRDFSDWSMGYLAYTQQNRHRFLRYSPNATFDPYQCTGAALGDMLRDLVESARALSKSVD